MTSVSHINLRYREIAIACAATIAAAAIAVPTSSAEEADRSPKPTAAPSASAVTKSASAPKVDAAIKSGPAVIIAHLPAGLVDQKGVVEARSGAQALGAPFVALSAASPEDAKEISRRFQIKTTPTVLVVDSDGTVRTEISGYADRATVEQAVANARR
jgi:hypothetical protein